MSGDQVFTQDRDPSAKQERVLCFHRETGAPLWHYVYPAEYGELDYGKGPRATPLVTEDRVYTLGAVGHLACLDRRTGRAIWTREAVRDFGARQPTWGFAASPIMHRQRLILHVGAADGCFLALDPASGEVIWRAGTDECGYATPIVIDLRGQELVIGWSPQHVLGIDFPTGRTLWQIPYAVTYGVSIATPIFAEQLVLVSGYWEGSKAIRLGPAPELATLAWEENRYLRGLMAQPLYRDGHIYLLDKHHGVVCCELASGRIVWNDQNRVTPAGRNPQASLVWAGPERMLALNSEGELVLARINPAGFEELGRTKITGPTWAHPAFCGDVVFARDDEQLVAVRLIR